MKEKETIEYLDLKSLVPFGITRSSCGTEKKRNSFCRALKHRAQSSR